VREFSVVIERDAEGYYVASVPALRGCHTPGQVSRPGHVEGSGDRGALSRKPGREVIAGLKKAVHTSHDGRKFIRSNEIVKLERFQEQIRKFKKLTEPGSKLVKG
jgi:hypothetical protein